MLLSEKLRHKKATSQGRHNAEESQNEFNSFDADPSGFLVNVFSPHIMKESSADTGCRSCSGPPDDNESVFHVDSSFAGRVSGNTLSELIQGWFFLLVIPYGQGPGSRRGISVQATLVYPARFLP